MAYPDQLASPKASTVSGAAGSTSNLSATSNSAGTTPELTGSRWRTTLLLAATLLLSALYMAKELKRGWVPMDEGTLGLSAQYVLQGQVPHRDYVEAYTGLLSYVNALAFRAFGADSASFRYMLYLFFLAWVPALWYVAARFVSAPLAAALTLLAVAWGPPNYAAAMPSWYNLFFATFGLAALLRYIENEKRLWLFLAGICGGISFLFKQVGLFFIAAVFLFLLFREQTVNTGSAGVSRRSRIYQVLLCACILLYEVLLLRLMLLKPTLVSLGYFFLPGTLLGIVILWREFSKREKPSHPWVMASREMVPFVAGVAFPIVIFLAPLLRAGALPTFFRDVFILPGKQIAYATMTPSLAKFIWGVGFNAAVVLGVFLLPRYRSLAAALALFTLAGGLLAARTMQSAYRILWGAIWVLLPTLVIIALVVIVRRSGELNEECRQRLFLMIVVAWMCALVQFPFMAPVYYCYVAPLVVLAAAAVITSVRRRSPLFLAGAFCFALLYAVFEVAPGSVYAMGSRYEPDTQTVRLGVPRAGGIKTAPWRATTYDHLNTVMRQHARGQYVFATPDCPEIYYLFGFRDPVGIFFDFFDEATGRTQRILGRIHQHDINLVVLNEKPWFSGQVPPDLRSALEQEFPNREEVGDFEVRWKP